jgi:hypothetical protein
MKKYFALLAIGTFALAQTATAQTTPKTATSTTKAGGTTTTKTTTKTNTTTAPTVGADGKEKGRKADKGDKENKGWKEMKAFHKLMSSSFHPAEDKNFKPLRAKADSLYMAALTWQKSVIPANFKPTETKDALDKLVTETKGIADAVKTGIQDSDLFTLINNAHETFHKIVGECRIDDGKEKKGDHKEGDHKDHKDGEHEKH